MTCSLLIINNVSLLIRSSLRSFKSQPVYCDEFICFIFKSLCLTFDASSFILNKKHKKKKFTNQSNLSEETLFKKTFSLFLLYFLSTYCIMAHLFNACDSLIHQAFKNRNLESANFKLVGFEHLRLLMTRYNWKLK